MKTGKMNWIPLPAAKIDWVYTADPPTDAKRMCIGHMRADFGSSGSEFWHSFFPHNPELVTDSFRGEFQDVVNGLRAKGAILESRPVMRKHCMTGLPIEEYNFGFMGETSDRLYCLRCDTRSGCYNVYLYCYNKDAMI